MTLWFRWLMVYQLGKAFFAAWYLFQSWLPSSNKSEWFYKYNTLHECIYKYSTREIVFTVWSRRLIIITLILSPMAGCGHRIAVQLNTWPTPSICFYWIPITESWWIIFQSTQPFCQLCLPCFHLPKLVPCRIARKNCWLLCIHTIWNFSSWQ